MRAEEALLLAHHHRVARVEVDNRTIAATPSVLRRAALAIGTVWSPASARLVAAQVRATGASIVHVHNFFPLLSPSIYGAARREGAAVVQTLHNYRLMCPAATLYRDGGPCEDCVGLRVPWPSITHACYRDSRAASAVVASMVAVHALRGTWRTDVDAFVALTGFARDRFVAGGLPPRRVHVKPNFVEAPKLGQRGAGDGFLYVGRLSPEKGVTTLLAAMRMLPRDLRLRIAGDGPLVDEVRHAAAGDDRIQVLGYLSREAVAAEMLKARALVFPSQWYETFGMVWLEAYASGLPVIASRLGAMSTVIHEGETGLLFAPRDATGLAERMRWAQEHPGEMRAMGRAARRVATAEYASDANYERLMTIYRTALAHRRSRADRRARPR